MNYKILKTGKLYDDADRIIYAGCKCSYVQCPTEQAYLIDTEIEQELDTAVLTTVSKSKDVA